VLTRAFVLPSALLSFVLSCLASFPPRNEACD
jgi:hypothetical protein